MSLSMHHSATKMCIAVEVLVELLHSSRTALHRIVATTFALSACTSVQVLLTRELSKGMIERNRGHIINVSSIAGHFAYPGGARLAFRSDALLRPSTA